MKSVASWAAIFVLSLFMGHMPNLSHSFFLSLINMYDPDTDVKLTIRVWSPLGGLEFKFQHQQ